ncbi:MAG: carboxypeptidase regulatory-like domain-containing protein, partial [Bacteroidota bacterium]|nr:carboxypeptidase regulatory-like domain-containing protein [Bacteroidota bacterium]
GGKIRGTVTDAATNAPLAGALVFASGGTQRIPPSGSNSGYHARTDAHGDYEITGLPDGDYTVSAQAQNYIQQYYDGKTDPTAADKVTIASASTAGGIDFALDERQPDPVYTIEGTVYDNSNTPVEGAVIYAEMQNGPMLRWLQTRSHSDGSYTLEVPPGTFIVWAMKQGLLTEYYDNVPDASQATGLTLDANNTAHTGIDFSLSEGGVLTGVVRDEASGNPIENALVSAFVDRNTYPGGNTSGNHARTDAHGRYRISGLATGDWYVQASMNGYASEYYDDATDLSAATKVAVTDGQETSDIDFALGTFGGSIAGTVRDANGNAVADAVVRAWANQRPAPNSAGRNFGTARSAADGSYLITGLPPADYIVRAEAKDFLPEYYDDTQDMSAATKVTVARQAVSGIDFSLTSGGSISGRITDEDSGDPIAHAVVFVRSTTHRFERGAHTDASGDYAVHGLPSGDYTVFAAARGHLGEYYDDAASANSATIISVNAPSSVTGIDLALATAPVAPRSYRGQVSARGGIPPFVLVEAVNPVNGLTIRTTTNAQGAFDIQAWDNAVIRVRALGYVGQYAGGTHDWKESRWDGATNMMTFMLEAQSETGMAEVRGSIRDATSGEGLVDAWVYGMDASGSLFFTVTGKDGGYLIPNTANGSLDIMVSEVGYETAFGDADVEDARGSADITAQRSSVTDVT